VATVLACEAGFEVARAVLRSPAQRAGGPGVQSRSTMPVASRSPPSMVTPLLLDNLTPGQATRSGSCKRVGAGPPRFRSRRPERGGRNAIFALGADDRLRAASTLGSRWARLWQMLAIPNPFRDSGRGQAGAWQGGFAEGISRQEFKSTKRWIQGLRNWYRTKVARAIWHINKVLTAKSRRQSLGE
jgi:hypothetical protein